MCQLDQFLADDLEPIHGEFGLTYASYLILHRSLMEAMPLEWQRRMVQCIREFWREFDVMKVPEAFEVRRRDDDGRYMSDPFSNYRHPSKELIDSVRLPKEVDNGTG